MQWGLAIVSALMIGFAKTGVPGAGILSIPLLAAIWGGRAAAGATLPMLIFADCFAVFFYRRHAQLYRLSSLWLWMVIGLALGVLGFIVLDNDPANKNRINVVIGVLILFMLALQLARMRFAQQLTPTSKPAQAFVGVAAGFTTMISNAAGPIMSVYMSALEMSKDVFMGTTAWYFFLINLLKVPILVVLGFVLSPFFTAQSLTFDVMMFPLIALGALIGKWALGRIPQRGFTFLVLALSAVAAIRLIVG